MLSFGVGGYGAGNRLGDGKRPDGVKGHESVAWMVGAWPRFGIGDGCHFVHGLVWYRCHGLVLYPLEKGKAYCRFGLEFVDMDMDGYCIVWCD